MKRSRVFMFVGALLFLMLALMVFQKEGWSRVDGRISGASRASDWIGNDASTTIGKTKLGERSAPEVRPTHLPAALPRFFLPSVRIEELTLSEALDLILQQYLETCDQTGEVPLKIKFRIPPNEGKRISLNLNMMSFDQAVNLIAAISGFVAERTGVTYRFLELPGGERGSGIKTIRGRPEIAVDLAKLLGVPEGTLQEIISGFGILKGTQAVISTTENGAITIVGGTVRDRELISNLLTKTSVKNPVQHKLTTRIVELPDGFDLGVSDGTVLTDSGLQVLMRRLASTEGTNFLTMPTMVTLPDESGNMEIGEEIIAPKAGVVKPISIEDFSKFTVGKSVTSRMSPVGFGHEMEFRYEDSDVSGSSDGALSKHKIVSTETSGYQMDDGTKVIISRRDDGGYNATFVSATLMDVTGRPISQSGAWQDTYRE